MKQLALSEEMLNSRSLAGRDTMGTAPPVAGEREGIERIPQRHRQRTHYLKTKKGEQKAKRGGLEYFLLCRKQRKVTFPYAETI